MEIKIVEAKLSDRKTFPLSSQAVFFWTAYESDFVRTPPISTFLTPYIGYYSNQGDGRRGWFRTRSHSEMAASYLMEDELILTDTQMKDLGVRVRWAYIPMMEWDL